MPGTLLQLVQARPGYRFWADQLQQGAPYHLAVTGRGNRRLTLPEAGSYNAHRLRQAVQARRSVRVSQHPTLIVTAGRGFSVAREAFRGKVSGEGRRPSFLLRMDHAPLGLIVPGRGTQRRMAKSSQRRG